MTETEDNGTITVNKRALAAYVASTRYALSRVFGQQTAVGGARQ